LTSKEYDLLLSQVMGELEDVLIPLDLSTNTLPEGWTTDANDVVHDQSVGQMLEHEHQPAVVGQPMAEVQIQETEPVVVVDSDTLEHQPVAVGEPMAKVQQPSAHVQDEHILSSSTPGQVETIDSHPSLATFSTSEPEDEEGKIKRANNATQPNSAAYWKNKH
jgi:hypothetical protein